MEKFIFLIESHRDESGKLSDILTVDFEGYDYELTAAFVLLGKKNDFLKSAILYAADHLRGEHIKSESEDLRKESRVKEDQQNNTL
jgi:hypothetical protein